MASNAVTSNAMAPKAMAPNPMVQNNTQLQISKEQLSSQYMRYFGHESGGANLLAAIDALSEGALQRLYDTLTAVKAAGRTVYVMGNGGSFDNALLFAAQLQQCGIRSRPPGSSERYFSGAYERIFADALISDGVGPGDLVVGLSGSGNSENIIAAFEAAKQRGAGLLALGGRDGGKMRTIAGEQSSIIAKSEIMEAIEDVHAVIGTVVTTALAQGVTLAAARQLVRSAVGESYSPAAAGVLGEIAAQLLRTILHERTAFIVGAGLGARHMRADAQRGFTNGVPVRGLSTPEFFTVNSGMATANDDGIDFLLADGLAKLNPQRDDFALLFNLPGMEHFVPPARELLQSAGTPIIEVGLTATGLDLSPLFRAGSDGDFAVTPLAHSTGVVLRTTLWEAWQVRQVTPPAELLDMRGRKKLLWAECVELESELRRLGHIRSDEVISFVYGKIYAAKDPAVFGVKRGYY